MPRYIDAEKIRPYKGFFEKVDNVPKFYDWVESLPTADVVKAKHGKWERHYSRPNVFADLYWHCSACGYKNDNQWANVYHLYCPNCGSRNIPERSEDERSD